MKYEFNSPTEREYDLIAIGRACIDLNATEYNRPMEETMTFTKYVGGFPGEYRDWGFQVGLEGRIYWQNC